jgi:hypothetical protein
MWLTLNNSLHYYGIEHYAGSGADGVQTTVTYTELHDRVARAGRSSLMVLASNTTRQHPIAMQQVSTLMHMHELFILLVLKPGARWGRCHIWEDIFENLFRFYISICVVSFCWRSWPPRQVSSWPRRECTVSTSIAHLFHNSGDRIIIENVLCEWLYMSYM